MIYNAMKLFMEVNPTLFDECSHEWTDANTNKLEREKARQSKWEKLAQQAKTRKASISGGGAGVDGVAELLPATSSSGAKIGLNGVEEHPTVDGPTETVPTHPVPHERLQTTERLARFGDLQIQEASVTGRLATP